MFYPLYCLPEDSHMNGLNTQEVIVCRTDYCALCWYYCYIILTHGLWII